jgi:hypothetical protein
MKKYKNMQTVLERNFLIFMILCYFSTKNVQAQSTALDGIWKDSTDNSGFVINLKQEGTKIEGTHISIQYNGEKVDAPFELSDITIQGKIDSISEASVSFKSAYSETSGIAKISLLGNGKVKWKIISFPSGEYHIPNEAILERGDETELMSLFRKCGAIFDNQLKLVN